MGLYSKNSHSKGCDCCNDDISTTNPPSCTDCGDGWNKESKEANNNLVKVNAKLGKIQSMYKNEIFWNTNLKKYLDAFEQTDRSAADVKNKINTFNGYLEGVCKYSKCTINALEYLSCKVWDKYKCLNSLFLNIENLENEIKELQEPLLNSGTIMKYIGEYKNKVKTAREAVEVAIPKVLDTLQTALKIYALICNECELCGQPGKDREYDCGLVSNLNYLHGLVCDTYVVVDDCDPCKVDDYCDTKFPLINKKGDPIDALAIKVKEKYDISEIKKHELDDQLQKQIHEREVAKFKSDGLLKAIAASQAAGKC
jgi:hypothetical protein